MAAVVRDCFLPPCARPVNRRQTILLPMSTPTECPSHAAVPRTSACILPHSAEEINSLCAQPSANLVVLLDADIYTNVPVLHATAIFNFAAKPPVTLLRTRSYCRSSARLRLDCDTSMPCRCPCLYASSMWLLSACLVPVGASSKHRGPSIFRSGLIQVSSGVANNSMRLYQCVVPLSSVPTTCAHHARLFNLEVQFGFPFFRNFLTLGDLKGEVSSIPAVSSS